MADTGTAERPVVAFAMGSGDLRDGLIDAAAMTRLRAVADVIAAPVLQDFTSPEAKAVLSRTTALITGWGCPLIDEAVLDDAPRLRLIAHAAGTVKHHVSEAAWDRSVVVTTAAQANALPVAEYTLAFILLAGKGVFTEQERLRSARSAYRTPAPGSPTGNHGGTVGIIGASTIGRLVLERLRDHDLHVLLADPTLNPSEAAQLGAELVPLPELLARSRVVSLHAPVLPSTLGMIGREQLARMPDGATFINTARGVLVDHEALRAEVHNGRLNAVLDVTDPEPLPDADPLYDLPNVLLTPHVAGSQGNELARMGALAVDEVARLAKGLPAHHPISRAALAGMA